MASSRRVAARPRGPDPSQPPFSGFLERDAVRERRERGRRWTLIISLGAHIAVVVALLIYSFIHVDDLFGPSVEVKMFAPSAVPSGANHQDDPNRPLR